MTAEKKTPVYKVSEYISGIFNPLFSLLLFFIWKELHFRGYDGILHRFLPGLLILLLPISLWIFWNVKSGRYTNFDVSDRKQRKSLYFFIEALLLAFILINRLFLRGKWDADFIFLLMLLIIMQVSNYFIKSSMHTAFNIFVAGLYSIHSTDWKLCAGWLILSVIVGITRIILKKHTPQEVMMGALLGAAVWGMMYLYTGAQLIS